MEKELLKMSAVDELPVSRASVAPKPHKSQVIKVPESPILSPTPK